MKLKEILILIEKLGIELVDHNHKWSKELKQEYVKVTKYLSSC